MSERYAPMQDEDGRWAVAETVNGNTYLAAQRYATRAHAQMLADRWNAIMDGASLDVVERMQREMDEALGRRT